MAKEHDTQPSGAGKHTLRTEPLSVSTMAIWQPPQRTVCLASAVARPGHKERVPFNCCAKTLLCLPSEKLIQKQAQNSQSENQWNIASQEGSFLCVCVCVCVPCDHLCRHPLLSIVKTAEAAVCQVMAVMLPACFARASSPVQGATTPELTLIMPTEPSE